MALEHPNLYGDVGAFLLPTRIHYLKVLLRDPRLLDKIVYASDFPTLVLTFSCVFELGLKKTMRLGRIKNPFDKPYLAMREMGFPAEVFGRARHLLRIPADKIAPEPERVSA